MSKRKSSKLPTEDSFEVKLGDDLEKLLDTHKESLDALREQVSEEIQKTGDIACETDDIFLLRFILSGRGDMNKTVENVKKTLIWRKENLEDLKCIKQHMSVDKFYLLGAEGSQRRKDIETLGRLMCRGSIGDFGPLGCPSFVVRVKYNKANELMNTFDPSFITKILLLQNEIGFQICDKRTREARKMVKVINIIDVRGFSLFGQMFDPRFFKCLGESSKKSEVLYPQLLGKVCIVNAGSLVGFLLKISRRFMSKRSVEKQAFCPAKSIHKRQDTDKCPFLTKMDACGSIPAFLGGIAPCPESLFRIEN